MLSVPVLWVLTGRLAGPWRRLWAAPAAAREPRQLELAEDGAAAGSAPHNGAAGAPQTRHMTPCVCHCAACCAAGHGNVCVVVGLLRLFHGKADIVDLVLRQYHGASGWGTARFDAGISCVQYGPAGGVVAVGDRAGRGSQRGEMALKAEGGSDEDVCFICYEASPPPIQSGCACRGPAGLVHLGCRVQAASYHQAAQALVDRKDSSRWWFTCQTCKQVFTGAMRIGLANAWWSQVRDRAEEDAERLKAAQNLASSLAGQGKYAEAEEMLREMLAVRKRVLGAEHPDTLAAARDMLQATWKRAAEGSRA